MTALHPEVVGEVVRVSPAQINADLPGRIGLYYPVKAEGLSCRIKVDGQLEPILIAKSKPRAKQPWRLIAGLHRLRACELLGRDVEARIVAASEDELMRMQASENVDRRTMTMLETSMFVAAIADAARRRVMTAHGEASQHSIAAKAKAARGNLHRAEPSPTEPTAGKQKELAEASAQEAADNLAQRYGWREDVMDACGLSVDKLKRMMRIYRGIVEPFRELIDGIKDCPICDNQNALLVLAGQPMAFRKKALNWLAANPAATFEEIAVALEASPSKGDRVADRQQGQSKFLERLNSNLIRLTPSVFASWVPTIVEKIPPSSRMALFEAQVANASSAERSEMLDHLTRALNVARADDAEGGQ